MDKWNIANVLRRLVLLWKRPKWGFGRPGKVFNAMWFTLIVFAWCSFWAHAMHFTRSLYYFRKMVFWESYSLLQLFFSNLKPHRGFLWQPIQMSFVGSFDILKLFNKQQKDRYAALWQKGKWKLTNTTIKNNIWAKRTKLYSCGKDVPCMRGTCGLFGFGTIFRVIQCNSGRCSQR